MILFVLVSILMVGIPVAAPLILFTPIAFQMLLPIIGGIVMLFGAVISGLYAYKMLFIHSYNLRQRLNEIIYEESIDVLEGAILKLARAHRKFDSRAIKKYKGQIKKIQKLMKRVGYFEPVDYFLNKTGDGYVNNKVQIVLGQMYARTYYKILPRNLQTLSYLSEQYKRLGIDTFPVPTFKEIKTCVNDLEDKIYRLDQKIDQEGLDKQHPDYKKRQQLVKMLGACIAIKKKLWWQSVTGIGFMLSPMRIFANVTGLAPFQIDPAKYVIEHREAFLKKRCAYANTPEKIDFWSKAYTKWTGYDYKKQILRIKTKESSFFGLYQPTVSVTKQHDYYAEKHLEALIAQDEQAMHFYFSLLQNKNEQLDISDFLARHHRLVLEYKINEWTGDEEKKESLITAYGQVMQVSSTEDRKSLIQMAYRAKKPKYESLMEEVNRKCITSNYLKSSNINHLGDIEQYRLQDFIGEPWPNNATQEDFDRLGCYSPPDLQKVLSEFKDSNKPFKAYMKVALDSKLYRSIEVYELRLSQAMCLSKYQLEEPEKSMLDALKEVRRVLKKDETIDLFRDVFLPITLLQFVFSAFVSTVYNPIYGGVVLTLLSAVGLANNMRVKGKDDQATGLFLLTCIIGVAIVAIQLAVIANVVISGAPLIILVLSAVGATMSFISWVVRGAKRSIDSERYVNPRISMICGKMAFLTKKLEKSFGNMYLENVKKGVFDFSVSQEDLHGILKNNYSAAMCKDILAMRSQLIEMEDYLTMVTKQQVNLIRTVRNTINKDLELSIITKRCEEIAEMRESGEISQEASICLLKPLLEAKANQEKHTNRNMLFASVSTVPIVVGTVSAALGFSAISVLFPPALPLIIGGVLLSVQTSAILSYVFIHAYEKNLGENGCFHKKSEEPEVYLEKWHQKKNPLDMPLNKKYKNTGWFTWDFRWSQNKRKVVPLDDKKEFIKSDDRFDKLSGKKESKTSDKQ